MARPQTRRDPGLALFHDVERLLDRLGSLVPAELWAEAEALWTAYNCTELGSDREANRYWPAFERRVRRLEVRLARVWVGEVRV
jgi:hypothetical protein